MAGVGGAADPRPGPALHVLQPDLPQRLRLRRGVRQLQPQEPHITPQLRTWEQVHRSLGHYRSYIDLSFHQEYVMSSMKSDKMKSTSLFPTMSKYSSLP